MKKLITCLLIVMTTAVLADTTLTYTTKKGKVAMQMQFAANKMRATSVDDNSSFMIYDANLKTFTMVTADSKQYYVMGEEQIATLSDVGAMMDKMMAEQLANVPEAQREMMRNMLEGAIKSQMPKQAPKPVYSMTGESASYNGFDCRIVRKKIGKKKSHFCVTEYSELGMSESDYSVITSFQQTIEVLAQQFGADNSMDFSSLGSYMPVKFKQEGKTGILSNVSHDTLDASVFSIPADYKEMKMPF